MARGCSLASSTSGSIGEQTRATIAILHQRVKLLRILHRKRIDAVSERVLATPHLIRDPYERFRPAAVIEVRATVERVAITDVDVSLFQALHYLLSIAQRKE